MRWNLPELAVHLAGEPIYRVENHLLSFALRRFWSPSGGNLAHFAEEVLQDGSLPALLPIQGDGRNERDRWPQRMGCLTVQFEQFGAVGAVVAFLDGFDFHSVLLGTAVECVLRDHVVPDHAGHHIQPNFGIVYGFHHAGMDDVCFALDRTVLAVE